MRKSFLGLLALPLLFSSNLAFAADEADSDDAESGEAQSAKPADAPDPATASILIEPALAIFGFYEGDIGIALDDNIAVSVWGQYFDYTLLGTGISGWGVGVGAPIFLSGEVFRGAYLYPLIKFQQVTFDVTDVDAVTATFYGPLLTGGYQWTWGRPAGFSLRIGGGLEYSLGQIESDNVDSSLSFEGIDYELDAAIGVAF
jgi:hypothetical protein